MRMIVGPWPHQNRSEATDSSCMELGRRRTNEMLAYQYTCVGAYGDTWRTASKGIDAKELVTDFHAREAAGWDVAASDTAIKYEHRQVPGHAEWCPSEPWQQIDFHGCHGSRCERDARKQPASPSDSADIVMLT